MERDKLISEIRQLFIFHKQATALEFEYSDEIYEYLVENSVIVLTNEQKLDIFAQAKRLYSTELSMQVESDELAKSKEALEILKNMKINRLAEQQNAYLGSLCKKICLKQYFDSIVNLPL